MNIEILKREISFRTSRSSGSGGQHVNKVATKVELIFNVEASEILTEEQKALILKRLSNRINKDGELTITCQESRSQLKNKQIAWQKFEKLLQKALAPAKKRKKVKPLVAEKKKRLASKKKQSEKKALRKKVDL